MYEYFKLLEFNFAGGMCLRHSKSQKYFKTELFQNCSLEEQNNKRPLINLNLGIDL